MGKTELANVEENWVYSTDFSKFRTKQILAALPLQAEELIDKQTFLVIPHKGHEKAVRLICSRVFKRIKSDRARRILQTREPKTATQS